MTEMEIFSMFFPIAIFVAAYAFVRLSTSHR